VNKRKRRQFTPEFKQEVVELIRKADKPLNQICRDMDLTPSAVKRWVDQAEELKQSTSDSTLSDIEKQELNRLTS